MGKKVLMISLGPSRADRLEGVDKMERQAGDVLRAYLDEVLKWVLCVLWWESGCVLKMIGPITGQKPRQSRMFWIEGSWSSLRKSRGRERRDEMHADQNDPPTRA
jgi:hypothetical protein